LPGIPHDEISDNEAIPFDWESNLAIFF